MFFNIPLFFAYKFRYHIYIPFYLCHCIFVIFTKFAKPFLIAVKMLKSLVITVLAIILVI